MTKLIKLLSKQKQALRTIPIPTSQSESRSKQLMKELCILNIYRLNIYNVLILTFKVKNSLIPDDHEDHVSGIKS